MVLMTYAFTHEKVSPFPYICLSHFLASEPPIMALEHPVLTLEPPTLALKPLIKVLEPPFLTLNPLVMWDCETPTWPSPGFAPLILALEPPILPLGPTVLALKLQSWP